MVHLEKATVLICFPNGNYLLQYLANLSVHAQELTMSICYTLSLVSNTLEGHCRLLTGSAIALIDVSLSIDTWHTING